MQRQNVPLGALLDRIVRECLRDGLAVDLEGLGSFSSDSDGDIQFVADPGVRVFIAYVAEDLDSASRLFDDLTRAGMSPWMDCRKLLPGQNWRRCIERAIDTADFFVPCFSRRSATKRGFFPYELRHALRCADRMPLDDAFILRGASPDCRNHPARKSLSQLGPGRGKNHPID